jgi:hypothetical protein
MEIDVQPTCPWYRVAKALNYVVIVVTKAGRRDLVDASSNHPSILFRISALHKYQIKRFPYHATSNLKTISRQTTSAFYPCSWNHKGIVVEDSNLDI